MQAVKAQTICESGDPLDALETPIASLERRELHKKVFSNIYNLFIDSTAVAFFQTAVRLPMDPDFNPSHDKLPEFLRYYGNDILYPMGAGAMLLGLCTGLHAVLRSRKAFREGRDSVDHSEFPSKKIAATAIGLVTFGAVMYELRQQIGNLPGYDPKDYVAALVGAGIALPVVNLGVRILKKNWQECEELNLALLHIAKEER